MFALTYNLPVIDPVIRKQRNFFRFDVIMSIDVVNSYEQAILDDIVVSEELSVLYQLLEHSKYDTSYFYFATGSISNIRE